MLEIIVLVIFSRLKYEVSCLVGVGKLYFWNIIGIGLIKGILRRIGEKKM